MANENTFFILEKQYKMETIGGYIKYVLDNKFKGGAIPVRSILEIVCKLALEGNCQFFEVKHIGDRPDRIKKVIIDKDQYDSLIALVNA